MKLLILCISLAVLRSSLGINPATEEEEWQEWKARYGKGYPTDEEDEDRRNVWLENYDYVAAHNALNDVTYKLELNKFADELSPAISYPDHEKVHEEILVKDKSAPKQFDWRKKGVVGAVKKPGSDGICGGLCCCRQVLTPYLQGLSEVLCLTSSVFTRPRLYLQLSPAISYPDHEKVHEEILVKDKSAPKQFDWRKKGVVGAVKNQGQMGYVEAFVAAECVESLHAIQTGRLYDLSAQEVEACCREFLQLPIENDVFGCIHKIGGLCTAATYKPSSQCSNTSCEPVAQTQGTKYVPANNEGALLEALLTVPVFVTVNASPQSFLMYKSGVYSDPQCTGGNLDHVLQLVGYGTDEEGNAYWICKNSWGEDWGMEGYVYIQRGVNRCGIAEDAKYPY
ncbi:procathepsin L-like [Haliotis rubra]|uniref:procathepsin L-like n=1 Tax=Haliotis rubra TaxID=36100 RepID=UPI001EE62455|nr:procathepsin L-like [Haliotis rubra]